MANLWELPTSIFANGHEYEIRTDFRAVLDVLTALSDKEMQGDTEEETRYIQAELIRQIMLIHPDNILSEDLQSAIEAVVDFIDMGASESRTDDRKHPRLMDWEQDAGLIIPAINRVVGREIRAEKYMHWWTFLGAYYEIGECVFSKVISIRNKKAKGKKLEKWEQEFIAENKDIFVLRDKLTEQEKAEQLADEKALNDLLG